MHIRPFRQLPRLYTGVTGSVVGISRWHGLMFILLPRVYDNERVLNEGDHDCHLPRSCPFRLAGAHSVCLCFVTSDQLLGICCLIRFRSRHAAS